MKAVLVVIVVIILGAGGWYYFTEYRNAASEPPPPPAEAIEEPAVDFYEPPVEPETQEPEIVTTLPLEPEIEAAPLPTLAESDAAATEELGNLLGESVVTNYFESEDLISRSVASVDALSSKQVPAAIQTVKGPGGDFAVSINDSPESPILNEEGDSIPQYTMDPANYSRYLVYVEMLEALDAGQISLLFDRYQPLLEQAFSQLGYPEGDFRSRLAAVIGELLATPDVQDPPRLYKPEAYYLYVDEELESLSAGQKILIRMGPENAARVKVKLREIQAAIEAG